MYTKWVALTAVAMIGLVACSLPCHAQPEPTVPPGQLRGPDQLPPLRLAYDQFPDNVRERMRIVVEQPTLARGGIVETFGCQPDLYTWLLDNPDKTSNMWRQLGARCVPITKVEPDVFSWSDPDYGYVNWRLVHRENGMRVWFADGKVRAAALVPANSFQAVLVARYRGGRDGDGESAVRHQYHLYLKTDGKAAAVVARLLGASAPKLLDQFVAQLQMFFQGLAWLADDQPARARGVMRGVVPNNLTPVSLDVPSMAP